MPLHDSVSRQNQTLALPNDGDDVKWPLWRPQLARMQNETATLQDSGSLRHRAKAKNGYFPTGIETWIHIKQAEHEYSCRFSSYRPQTGDNQDAIQYINKPWCDRKGLICHKTKPTQLPSSNENKHLPLYGTQIRQNKKTVRWSVGARVPVGWLRPHICHFVTKQICAPVCVTKLLHPL